MLRCYVARESERERLLSYVMFSDVVPCVVCAGEEEAELPFALTNDPTVLNVTETEGVPEFLG